MTGPPVQGSHARTMAALHQDAVWPWAESNQGMLTFAALVIALLFALVEQRRANTETRRRIREYAAVVLELTDGYLADLRPLSEAAVANAPAMSKWNHDRAMKRKTLDLLRQSCPAEGRLVLLLNELDQTFENPFPAPGGQGLQLPAAGPQPKLKEMVESVDAVRRKIAART